MRNQAENIEGGETAASKLIKRSAERSASSRSAGSGGYGCESETKSRHETDQEKHDSATCCVCSRTSTAIMGVCYLAGSGRDVPP